MSETTNGQITVRHMYACFVLHNFCEIHNESINGENVRMTINYHRDFQPQKWFMITVETLRTIIEQLDLDITNALATFLSLSSSDR